MRSWVSWTSGSLFIIVHLHFCGERTNGRAKAFQYETNIRSRKLRMLRTAEGDENPSRGLQLLRPAKSDLRPNRVPWRRVRPLGIPWTAEAAGRAPAELCEAQTAIQSAHNELSSLCSFALKLHGLFGKPHALICHGLGEAGLLPYPRPQCPHGSEAFTSISFRPISIFSSILRCRPPRRNFRPSLPRLWRL